MAIDPNVRCSVCEQPDLGMLFSPGELPEEPPTYRVTVRAADILPWLILIAAVTILLFIFGE